MSTDTTSAATATPDTEITIASAAYALINVRPIRTDGGALTMPPLPDAALTRQAVHDRLSLIAARLELTLLDHVDQMASMGVNTPPAYQKFNNAVHSLSRLTAIQKSLDDYLAYKPRSADAPVRQSSFNQPAPPSPNGTAVKPLFMTGLDYLKSLNLNPSIPPIPPIHSVPSCPTLPIESILPMLTKVESELTAMINSQLTAHNLQPIPSPDSQLSTHNSQPIPDNCPDCANCSTTPCEMREIAPDFLTCDKTCGSCSCSSTCFYSPYHPHYDPG